MPRVRRLGRPPLAYLAQRRQGVIFSDPAGHPYARDVTTALSALGGAPASASFVTVAAEGGLSAERSLAGTANQIILTDGGANGALTLSTPQNLHTGATPQFARLGLGAAADASAVAKFAGQAFSAEVDDGSSGTAKTLDWNAGNVHYVTLTGNVTFTLSNPKAGAEYLIVIATGAGGFTATWPASVKWPGGVAPVITAGAGKIDLIRLVYSGVAGAYLGAFTQNY